MSKIIQVTTTLSKTQTNCLLWFYNHCMYTCSKINIDRWASWSDTGYMMRTINVLIKHGLVCRGEVSYKKPNDDFTYRTNLYQLTETGRLKGIVARQRVEAED